MNNIAKTNPSDSPSIRVIHSRDFHWVGNGFPVRSIFSYNDLGLELSPFLLLDYAPPYSFSPGNERRGVEAHPHRGFETVTIVYQGELEHRDSNGGGGTIGPGDVQWMTAGSGLLHEEFHSEHFVSSGGVFEVAQLWVNLPAKDKGAKPNYQTLLNAQIPKVEVEGGKVRVISGEFDGMKGPAKTFTTVNLWDVSVASAKDLSLPLQIGDTKAILVLRGEISVEGNSAKEGDLIIIGRESGAVKIRSLLESKLLVMSGEPIAEPIVGYGPFVMNNESEIKQAFVDFKTGKFGSL